MRQPQHFAAAFLLALNTFLLFVALPVLFFAEEGHAQNPGGAPVKKVLVAPIGGVPAPKGGLQQASRVLRQALADELNRLGVAEVIPLEASTGQLRAAAYQPTVEGSLRVARNLGATHVLMVRIEDYLRLDSRTAAISLKSQLRDVNESGRLLWKGKSVASFAGDPGASADAEAARIVARAFSPGALFAVEHEPRGLGQTLDPQPAPTPRVLASQPYNGTGEPGDSIPDRRDTRHQAQIPPTNPIQLPTGTDRPRSMAGEVPPAPQTAVTPVTPVAESPRPQSEPVVAPPPVATTPPASATPVRAVIPVPPPAPVLPTLASAPAVPAPQPIVTLPKSNPFAGKKMTTVGTFYFRTNSADLNDRNAAGAAQLAHALAALPDVPVVIDGHADPRGADSTNHSLSQDRAEAVKLALLTGGAGDAQRFHIQAHADGRLAAQGDQPNSHARNRRVEVSIPASLSEEADPIQPVVSPGMSRLQAILSRIRRDRGAPVPPPPAGLVEAAARAVAGLGQPPMTARSAAPTDSEDEFISPGDSLRIQVQGRDELSRTVTIGPDGTLRFPLVERLPMEGLSTKDAEIKLQAALGKYIVKPEVQIVRVYRIKVFGLVSRQGVQEYDYAPSITEVLARAEGVQFESRPPAGSVIYGALVGRIIRAGREQQSFDLTHFMETGRGLEGRQLRDGDSLIIDSQKHAPVTLLGTVKTTVLYRPGLRLLEAIALAGGIIDETRQNIKNVRVIRELEDGKIQRLEVNLHDIIHRGQVNRDIALKPGDYVAVPRRRRRRTFLSVLGDALRPFTQASILKQTF